MSDRFAKATRTIVDLHNIATALRMPQATISKITAMHAVIAQMRKELEKNG
jgi:hypothetical protein